MNSVGNASDNRGLLVGKSVGSVSASSASASSAMSVDESARLSSLNLGDMELTEKSEACANPCGHCAVVHLTTLLEQQNGSNSFQGEKSC